ncbi:MAG: hypothetical protein JXB36_17100 [Gammaproteobacteria bacterium]|nr:hypothetical protein [Gammaproteobacteria bacterium]
MNLPEELRTSSGHRRFAAVTRRSLLAAVAAVFACRAAAGASPPAHRRTSRGSSEQLWGPRGRHAELAEALAGLVAERPGYAAAARIGQICVGALPARRPQAAALCRRVLPAAAARRDFLAAGTERRRRIIETRVAADFAAGRVTIVNGWVLAQTEAALCAVVAAYVARAADG